MNNYEFKIKRQIVDSLNRELKSITSLIADDGPLLGPNFLAELNKQRAKIQDRLIEMSKENG